MNKKIEIIKNYICSQIRKHGFKNNQINIDFTDIAEELEITQAATELEYKAEPAIGSGCWWIYR